MRLGIVADGFGSKEQLLTQLRTAGPEVAELFDIIAGFEALSKNQVTRTPEE